MVGVHYMDSRVVNATPNAPFLSRWCSGWALGGTAAKAVQPRGPAAHRRAGMQGGHSLGRCAWGARCSGVVTYSRGRCWRRGAGRQGHRVGPGRLLDSTQALAQRPVADQQVVNTCMQFRGGAVPGGCYPIHSGAGCCKLAAERCLHLAQLSHSGLERAHFHSELLSPHRHVRRAVSAQCSAELVQGGVLLLLSLAQPLLLRMQL